MGLTDCHLRLRVLFFGVVCYGLSVSIPSGRSQFSPMGL